VSSLKRVEPGVIVRAADAEIIPPLSDYEPFWEREIPFLFLSAGRSRVYHTPEDTPDKLDYDKIAATARWLTRFVRAARTRDATRFVHASLDRGTLDEVGEIVAALSALTPEAAMAQMYIQQLRDACDRAGNLPDQRRSEVGSLVAMLEARLQ
jgi:Peptidase family M28